MKLSEAPMLAVLERLNEIAKAEGMAETLIQPLKKIDMQACIDSQIDMEFSNRKDFSDFLIDTLHGIDDVLQFLPKHNHSAEYCRPRMNHIHACPDGWDKCPLPEGFVVKVYCRNEHSYSVKIGSEAVDWSHGIGCPESDIIAFKVTEISEGYTL